MRSAQSSAATAKRESANIGITWLRFDQGGRRRLPTRDHYRSVIQFDDDPNRTLGNWDVDVQFEEPPTYASSSPAKMAFISAGAPLHLLHTGSRFELSEGRKIVGHGRVL
jgi:hypothetical protein